ncbi:hypothetical protein [Pasteuria penetrans]|uniref:hypothetical protein n=1 Tax=Pasteuria penetrans TaxID=86005 RepID=UPI000FB03008|nr:hypothetical protein [Pasteuria penetrans]
MVHRYRKNPILKLVVLFAAGGMTVVSSPFTLAEGVDGGQAEPAVGGKQPQQVAPVAVGEKQVVPSSEGAEQQHHRAVPAEGGRQQAASVVREQRDGQRRQERYRADENIRILQGLKDELMDEARKRGPKGVGLGIVSDDDKAEVLFRLIREVKDIKNRMGIPTEQFADFWDHEIKKASNDKSSERLRSVNQIAEKLFAEKSLGAGT